MNFITREDLKSRGITFSNKHLIELESRGMFPKRVQIGLRTVVWSKEEVEAYIAGRLAARGAYVTRAMTAA